MLFHGFGVVYTDTFTIHLRSVTLSLETTCGFLKIKTKLRNLVFNENKTAFLLSKDILPNTSYLNGYLTGIIIFFSASHMLSGD